MSDRVYLDWNATAPLRPEARAAMASALDVAGNPSSVHAEGRAARALVEMARAQVAGLVGCEPQSVVFTSGATEAAQVLSRRPPGCDVMVQDTAHDALWAHFDLSNAVERPRGPGHTLAWGYANGETGAVTPPPEKIDGQYPYGTLAADWLLLDVTQAVGKVDFDFEASGADFAVLSAHKLGGPKGVGALIVRPGLDIEPLSVGGGQEMGRRAGTENVAGIAGFGAAAEASALDVADGVWKDVAKVRDMLEDAVAAAGLETIFVGKDGERLPNTSCLLTPGWKGETQVMTMDLAGFAISAGSACSSGKVGASRVLRAMGYDETQAASAIRVSLGPTTTEDEVLRFADVWIDRCRAHQRRAA